MTAKLKVSWRGEVYELPTCLDDKRAAEASALWPDGVVVLERVLEPGRETPFSEGERRNLVKMVLRALGEPFPSIANAIRERIARARDTQPATGGAVKVPGKPAGKALPKRRELTHETLVELAAKKPAGELKIRPGSAMRKLQPSA